MTRGDLDRFGELFSALPTKMQHLGLIGVSKTSMPLPLQRFVAFSTPSDHIRAHEGIANIPGPSRVHSVPKLARLYPNCAWIIEDLGSMSVVRQILMKFVAPLILMRLPGSPAEIVDVLTTARQLEFRNFKVGAHNLLLKEKMLQAD